MDSSQVPVAPHFDETLLPVYQACKEQVHGSIWEYLGRRGEYDLAAAFSKLFWPDFIEVDECVFLKEHYDPDNFELWKKQYAGSRDEIEAMINHVHISDLFLIAAQS